MSSKKNQKKEELNVKQSDEYKESKGINKTRFPIYFLLIGALILVAAWSLFRNINHIFNSQTNLDGADTKSRAQTTPLVKFSVIIPVRNEDEFLAKTINYFMTEGDPSYINEFVIYDDNSDIPVSSWLQKDTGLGDNQLKIIRSDTPQGLIIGRIRAAEIASSEYLFFLDGHCRPVKYDWAKSMIELLLEKDNRVVAPLISPIHNKTWEITWNSNPSFMMFDWTFQFYWQPATDPYIPIMAGGIYGISKKYFFESGSYDEGLKEWGGENIEQSIRIWSCGGEMYLDEKCEIGHIFERPEKPNEGNKLVDQVHRNHVRVARVWLDNYNKLFYKYHHSARHIRDRINRDPTRDDANIEERLKIRSKCKPFSWFVEKFRLSFDMFGLIEQDYMFLKTNDESYLMLDRETSKLSLTSLADIPKCKFTSEPLEGLWINYNGRRSLKIRNDINFRSYFVFDSHAVTTPKSGSTNIPVVQSMKMDENFQRTKQIVHFEVDRFYENKKKGRIMAWINEEPVDLKEEIEVPESTHCIIEDNGQLVWGDCNEGVYFYWSRT